VIFLVFRMIFHFFIEISILKILEKKIVNRSLFSKTDDFLGKPNGFFSKMPVVMHAINATIPKNHLIIHY
jgi:hypothetical protein